MSLGAKILISIFTISIMIATVGITSNWYSKYVLGQLVLENVETTDLVENTAKLENALYNSLVTLIILKELEGSVDSKIELKVPAVRTHIESFDLTIKNINDQIYNLSFNFSSNEELITSTIVSKIDELALSVQFYEQLCIEWLHFREENISQSHEMFNFSITPYFSNTIIPLISKLRENVIQFQIDENSKLKNQLDITGIFIFAMTTFLIILSVGVALFLYKSIANPIKKLSIGAQLIGKGNLDERIEVVHNDEIGDLAATFNTMAENLRKRTLARDYLDNIIESIHESLIVTDNLGRIVSVNKATERLLGFGRSSLMNVPLEEILEGDHALQQKEEPRLVFLKTIESKLVTKNGKLIPVLFSENELINSKQEFLGKVVVATDITERNKANEQIKESLREKEILLAEIHHRVKNNLAVISSIIELQSRSSDNQIVVEALTESQTRIRSISLVHEMLYQSETFANINYSAYIKDFVASITKSKWVVENKVTITTETEDLFLGLNIAVSCSMLLNELILNKLKNIELEPGLAKMHINLCSIDSMVELSIEHNFEGENTRNATQNLSYTLINTLLKQLYGTFTEQYLEEKGMYKIKIMFDKHLSLK